MGITVHLHGPAEGQEVTLEVRPGQSLMEAAIDANVAGIEADCGGLLTCATCHVYVREPWVERLPPASADEVAMLDFTAAERRPNSRLSCQLLPDETLDGLAVDLPPNQH